MELKTFVILVPNLLTVAGRMMLSTSGMYRVQHKSYLHAPNIRFLSTAPLQYRMAQYHCLFACQRTEHCAAANFETPDRCYLIKTKFWTETAHPDSTAFIIDMESRKTVMKEEDADGCPKGFGFKFEGHKLSRSAGQPVHCYKLVRKMMTWPKSVAACKGLGANLVSIESKHENDHVIKIITSGKRVGGLWMSGNNVRGKWVWHSTGQTFDFQSWHLFQPDIITWGSQACVRMFYMMNQYNWDDTYCSRKFAALCEVKI